MTDTRKSNFRIPIRIGLILLTVFSAGYYIIRFSPKSGDVSKINVIKPPIKLTDQIHTENLTEIDVIMGQKGESYHDRIRAINAKADNLLAEDIELLIGYLLTPTIGIDEQGNSIMVEASVRNDIINKLLGHKDLPEKLGQVLREIHSSPNQHVCLKDYALQHLPAWLNRIRQLSSDASIDWNQSEIAACQKILLEATRSRTNSLAGTALIALDRSKFINGPDIGELALELLHDPQSNDMTRVSALQMCVEYEKTDAITTARMLARNSRSIAVRSSAIHMIGMMGSASEGNFLNELDLQSNDQAIRSIIAKAQQRLVARN